MNDKELKTLCKEYNALDKKVFELEDFLDSSRIIFSDNKAKAYYELKESMRRMKELEAIFIKELGEDGFLSMIYEND